MKRRFTAMILAVVMIASMFSFGSLTASAASSPPTTATSLKAALDFITTPIEISYFDYETVVEHHNSSEDEFAFYMTNAVHDLFTAAQAKTPAEHVHVVLTDNNVAETKVEWKDPVPPATEGKYVLTVKVIVDNEPAIGVKDVTPSQAKPKTNAEKVLHDQKAIAALFETATATSLNPVLKKEVPVSAWSAGQSAVESWLLAHINSAKEYVTVVWKQITDPNDNTKDINAVDMDALTGVYAFKLAESESGAGDDITADEEVYHSTFNFKLRDLGIDYASGNDVKVSGTASGTVQGIADTGFAINLTTETIEFPMKYVFSSTAPDNFKTDANAIAEPTSETSANYEKNEDGTSYKTEPAFVPTFYSLDGGERWKKYSEKAFTPNKNGMMKFLNKEMTLVFTNAPTIDKTTKKPTENVSEEEKDENGNVTPAEKAITVTFGKTDARPKLDKFAVNYAIKANTNGTDSGRWVLAKKGESVAVTSGLQIAEFSGKTLDTDKGWGTFKADGVAVLEILGGTKAVKTAYAVRTAPTSTTPASKFKKYSVAGEAKALKPPKAKFNKKEGTTTLAFKKGQTYELNGTVTILDEKTVIGVTPNVTEITLWKTATEKKPASEPTPIRP